jgi:hypothetical protein
MNMLCQTQMIGVTSGFRSQLLRQVTDESVAPVLNGKGT